MLITSIEKVEFLWFNCIIEEKKSKDYKDPLTGDLTNAEYHGGKDTLTGAGMNDQELAERDTAYYDDQRKELQKSWLENTYNQQDTPDNGRG